MEKSGVTVSMVGNATVRRSFFLLVVLGITIFSGAAAMAQPADPLPSWTEGDLKQTIEQFVADITTAGSTHFVRPEDRIAVFDNDGTLWSEEPWVQGLFLEQLLRNAAARHPEVSEQQPYKAALAHDREFFETGGIRVMIDAVKAAMVELSREDFDAEVAKFFATARHPALDVPMSQTVYQPALELLDYLRANGFKTYICSGGGIDFMRVISADFYGIESEQVIGTSYRKELHEIDGRWELLTTSDLNPINNKDEKAINIDLHIGKRPLLVMGNAGGRGDIGMMNYSQGRKGVSLQLLIDHDDAAREFAYAEDDNASLNAAKKNGWRVISMKDDWSVIYPASDD
ncbi:MAG: haloacid dehalogenase-like hydrolase [Gammaproteobacteria bacterium]|nr:haloacid dehalogenase-like hydrolase [Gammaproteobacteria bacterium]